MNQRIPDLHALANGELKLLTETDRDFGRVGMQFAFGGLELADGQTWRDWIPARAVELWEACMLSLHLKPDGVQWALLDSRSSPRGPTIGAMLADRVLRAGQHAKRQSLPCIKLTSDPHCSLVTLWEFATWCDSMEIPCPAEMPRVDPSGKTVSAPADDTKRKRSVAALSDDFLRQADLIPGMLPFSPATLWRKVRKGEFPQPIKLSVGVTAWRRAEVEAWIQAQAQPKPRKGRRGD